MESLRSEVATLRHTELFEQAILRGSLITEQQETSAGDIDSIMQSMMGLSPTDPSAASFIPAAVSPMQPPPVPKFEPFSAVDPSFGESLGTPPFSSTPFFKRGAGFDTSPLAASTPGRRSTRLKVKTRRP